MKFKEFIFHIVDSQVNFSFKLPPNKTLKLKLT